MGAHARHVARRIRHEFVGGGVGANRNAPGVRVLFEGGDHVGAPARGRAATVCGNGRSRGRVSALGTSEPEGARFGESEAHRSFEPVDGGGGLPSKRLHALDFGVAVFASGDGRLLIVKPQLRKRLRRIVDPRTSLSFRARRRNGAARKRGGAADQAHLFEYHHFGAEFGRTGGRRHAGAARPYDDHVRFNA